MDVPVILIVGGGSIGERHLRCFQQVGCDVALCESNEARLAEMAGRYALRRRFGDLDAPASERWDGVVICTPANMHVAHAVKLAGATNALLIEKPLCTELTDVPRLQAAIEDKHVQVAYVLRAHPAVQQLRQWLAEDKIGDICQLTVVAGQHFPTYRPAYRQTYYARPESGGGAIQDAATHLFDLVQSLVGPLDWIFCDAAHQVLEGVEVEDTVHLLGRAGRAMVSIALNQFMAPNEMHVQLNGDRGSLALRLHEQRAGVFLHGDSAWTWTEPLVHERDDLFRAQARSFIELVAGHCQPLATLDDGIRALRVSVAALESSRTAQRVWING